MGTTATGKPRPYQGQGRQSSAEEGPSSEAMTCPYECTDGIDDNRGGYFCSCSLGDIKRAHLIREILLLSQGWEGYYSDHTGLTTKTAKFATIVQAYLRFEADGGPVVAYGIKQGGGTLMETFQTSVQNVLWWAEGKPVSTVELMDRVVPWIAAQMRFKLTSMEPTPVVNITSAWSRLLDDDE